MTFTPALPWPWLVAVAVVVVIARAVALQRSTSRLRWAGLTLAVLLVLVVAARPGIDTGRDTALAVEQPGPSADLNVFVAVDRSADAPVADMRADIEAMLDAFPDARFALISFATRATMDWPLSDDVWSLRSVVSGLSPYASGNPAQANAFAPRDVLYTKAQDALGEYPGSRNMVFYLGTGTPESVVARGEFETPPGLVTDGAVLGYGDQDVTRLQLIADQLGVPYTRGAAQLPEAGGPAVSATDLEVTERFELYWIFVLLAAALLLIEMALTLREYRRTRVSRRDVRL